MRICSFVLAAVEEPKKPKNQKPKTKKKPRKPKSRHFFSCRLFAKPSEKDLYLEFGWRAEPRKKKERDKNNKSKTKEAVQNYK